ncbi:hypothetical protein RDWZM_001218 [Blomia tropicalis]|uniref:SCP domain-containing protein n=1 Tax=Blomia tropicalis TaxID=40697 RepID=A0A9Q0MCP7_BLOTA|nr:hypothetical protein RDWZM_001218 [Blomia tropicalis]
MESQLNNQMESTETKVEEWIEDDGTRVIRTEVTTRIKPSYNIVEIGSLTSFEREFLEKHNEYRERHRVPPLHMSRDLCEYAQEWANNLAQIGKMSHRPSPRSTSMKIRGEEPVKSWYERGKDFNPEWYGVEPPQASNTKSGNFTQIIWKSSERLGVGLAIAGKGFFVVANYDPPGNCLTKYKNNLLPPIKDN